MLVKERMSHPVITVHPDVTMQEALDLLHKEHIRRLPVVNKQGKLIGIISERMLLKAAPSDATTLSVWEIKEAMNKVTVEKLMTREVITVAEDTPVEEAARIMMDKEISGLPVTRGDKLVGFITETDLFEIFLEMFGAREHGVRITALVDRGPGKLAALTKAIYELGGDIVALGISGGETTENGTITFKVSGVVQEALVKGIIPLVEKVIDVRDTRV